MAAVAQLAARRFHNPKVVSSILTCRSYWCDAREAPVHTSHMLQLSSRCSVVYPCYPLQALPMWDLCFFLRTPSLRVIRLMPVAPVHAQRRQPCGYGVRPANARVLPFECSEGLLTILTWLQTLHDQQLY